MDIAPNSALSPSLSLSRSLSRSLSLSRARALSLSLFLFLSLSLFLFLSLSLSLSLSQGKEMRNELFQPVQGQCWRVRLTPEFLARTADKPFLGEGSPVKCDLF